MHTRAANCCPVDVMEDDIQRGESANAVEELKADAAPRSISRAGTIGALGEGRFSAHIQLYLAKT